MSCTKPAACRATRLSPESFRKEFMNAQQLIDSIEQDLQRMRIDEALKASLVARLDELRKMQK